MRKLILSAPSRLAWPLPALLAWALAWAAFSGLAAVGVPAAVAALLAILPAGAIAWQTPQAMRRAVLLLGFPASLILLRQGQVPAWVWLLAALALLAVYPLRAWRDAPLYPTSGAALAGLAVQLALPGNPSILDAGSGLGHGLQALRAEWPMARLCGIERSGLLAWWARRRVPTAQIRRGDMWLEPWGPHHVVYLFQRPESMARAWHKACAEMQPGSWMVSLDFPLDGREPDHLLHHPGQRPVFAYRVPAPASQGAARARPAQHRRGPADKTVEPVALGAAAA
jgi:hypothetical protein